MAPDVDGHIFAFSRAARSGLPVHVHAFFDASQGLAWPGLRRAGAFSKGGAGAGEDFEAAGQGEEAAGGGEENSARSPPRV